MFIIQHILQICKRLQNDERCTLLLPTRVSWFTCTNFNFQELLTWQNTRVIIIMTGIRIFQETNGKKIHIEIQLKIQVGIITQGGQK